MVSNNRSLLTKKLGKSVLPKVAEGDWQSGQQVIKMNTVKKGQLGQMLAEKMGVTKKQGVEWLDAFVEVVTDSLRKGDKVNITGFGIFKVADRKAREGRNPRTGETIQIKASKKPRFTAGKVLKEAIM